jgi:hypothetical protein
MRICWRLVVRLLGKVADRRGTLLSPDRLKLLGKGDQMNHTIKFHKPTSPAFNPGEVWVSSCGVRVEISLVMHRSGNYEVTYFTEPEKDRVRLIQKTTGIFK